MVGPTESFSSFNSNVNKSTKCWLIGLYRKRRNYMDSLMTSPLFNSERSDVFMKNISFNVNKIIFIQAHLLVSVQIRSSTSLLTATNRPVETFGHMRSANLQ